MCTSPWRQFSTPLVMAPITAFGDFYITALTTSESGAREKNFTIRLATFNLFDLSLSGDCELPIKKL